MIAYSQRTVGRIGTSEIENAKRYYWVVELPQKKSQLFLSNNNSDLSEAETKLRAFAGSVSGGLLDVFKKTSKTGGYVRAERSGEAESIFDAEKAKGAKDREAKAVADGISGVFSPKREPK